MWRRAGRFTQCGRCGNHVAPADAVLEIQLPQVRAIKLRCEACAGEHVPADLPAFVPRRNVVAPSRLAPRQMMALAMDCKQRQVGDE